MADNNKCQIIMVGDRGRVMDSMNTLMHPECDPVHPEAEVMEEIIDFFRDAWNKLIAINQGTAH